jgi:hypothetical protein
MHGTGMKITFGGVFCYVPQVFRFHCWSSFLVKKQNFQTYDYSSQMLDDRILKLSNIWLMECFCDPMVYVDM